MRHIFSCCSYFILACELTGNWGWDYDQVGVVGTVRTGAELDRTAWQRFLPSGPLALLPLGDGLSSVVWSTTQRHASELVAMPDAAFIAALNSALTAPPSAFRQEREPTGANAVYDQQRDALHLDPLAAAVSAGHALAASAAAALEGAAGLTGLLPPPKAVEAVGKRAAFPLRLSKSNADVRQRLALIGCVKRGGEETMLGRR